MSPVRDIEFFRAPGERHEGCALQREMERSGREDELLAVIAVWQETGRIPPSWFHREVGTAFDAIGPPGSTVRVYFAVHANQIVVLAAEGMKSGRGKLSSATRSRVEERLATWRGWYPEGRRRE